MLSYAKTQSDDPQRRPRVLLECRKPGCTLTCPLCTQEWSKLLMGPCSRFLWLPVRFQNAAKPKDSQQINYKKALTLFLRSLGLIK